jgi:class 3 adenylate cyclase
LPFARNFKYLKEMAFLPFQTNVSGPLVDPEFPVKKMEEADSLELRLGAMPALRLHEMHGIWRSRPSGGWSDHPAIYRQLGEQILKRGEPFFAYDVLKEGTGYWPRDIRLRQLLGLTLARSGAVEHGNAILRELSNEGDADGETLGILARTYKDLWAAASDPSSARRNLKLSHDVYSQAYSISLERDDLESGYYNGINAATTALLLGLEQQARDLAGQVDQLCDRVILDNAPGTDLYWAVATRGEASLILGEFERATDHYIHAAHLAQGRYADLSSTRGQARILLTHLSQDPQRLDACFAIPSVVVFAGCDAGFLGPDPELEQKLRQAIRSHLEAVDAGFGYATLTGLSDLVFLEEMIAMEREAHVVMPLSFDTFLQNLGSIEGTSEWGHRFQRVLDRATQVQGTGDLTLANSTIARRYTQLVLDGLGRLHSHALNTPLVPLALTLGEKPQAPDSLVSHWDEMGDTVETIDITGLVSGWEGRSREEAVRSDPSADGSFPQHIMALLFADVVGYSKMTELEIPCFVQQFLGAIAALDAASSRHPVQKHTWGDAFYFVFEQIEDAGRFALRLSSLIDEIDWKEKGIVSPIELRIALHAGPVYLCDDPIVQRPNFCGTHVSLAARMEPVTPPGEVYVSQPFAALAKAQGISSFSCEYVGQLPLAKGYGVFPLYHIH